MSLLSFAAVAICILVWASCYRKRLKLVTSRCLSELAAIGMKKSATVRTQYNLSFTTSHRAESIFFK